MSSSRARVVVPVLLLLVVVAVVAGLLVGRGNDEEPSAAPTATATAPATAEPEPATEATAPDLTRRTEGDAMALGPVDAPVGIVVYSDYSCTYCQRWAQETLPTLAAYAEEGDVRLESRDVAILGEDSERAAVAAAAAARQGAYWEYHDLLMSDLQARSEEDLVAFAEQAGLDVEQFRADLTDPEVLAVVDQNMQEAQAVGLQSTPSFIVGGTPVVGAQPTDVFVEIIEAELGS
ncbi:thioredoxin [Georgenia sp. 311]|uniref:Thioredoxin n=1 Tax=Georgenia wutianyii TaxID=2585135 RepID=A0ABX5VMZ6_9MICO|nr:MULTISPECIES: thioredoxin domain-containing protein [Georgenia]QDB78419.1 thioredoxin [Georgenia wutianyii]TNC18418.1 thioredoxin [Georgenia sp. 311]